MALSPYTLVLCGEGRKKQNKNETEATWFMMAAAAAAAERILLCTNREYCNPYLIILSFTKPYLDYNQSLANFWHISSWGK